jgi:hypothetical protein
VIGLGLYRQRSNHVLAAAHGAAVLVLVLAVDLAMTELVAAQAAEVLGLDERLALGSFPTPIRRAVQLERRHAELDLGSAQEPVPDLARPARRHLYRLLK